VFLIFFSVLNNASQAAFLKTSLNLSHSTSGFGTIRHDSAKKGEIRLEKAGKSEICLSFTMNVGSEAGFMFPGMKC